MKMRQLEGYLNWIWILRAEIRKQLAVAWCGVDPFYRREHTLPAAFGVLIYMIGDQRFRKAMKLGIAAVGIRTYLMYN